MRPAKPAGSPACTTLPPLGLWALSLSLSWGFLGGRGEGGSLNYPPRGPYESSKLNEEERRNGRRQRNPRCKTTHPQLPVLYSLQRLQSCDFCTETPTFRDLHAVRCIALLRLLNSYCTQETMITLLAYRAVGSPASRQRHRSALGSAVGTWRKPCAPKPLLGPPSPVRSLRPRTALFAFSACCTAATREARRSYLGADC